MSQRDTVLRMLENAGERGVTTGQFIDAKIPRFSARIEELRRTHLIVRHRVTASRYRYELVGADDDSGWMVGAVDGIPGTHVAAGTSLPDRAANGDPERFPDSAGVQPSSQSLFDDDGEPAVMPAMYRDAA